MSVSSKSFKNYFSDYSPDQENSVLNDAHTGPSSKFIGKLQNYLSVKHTLLTTKMVTYIFNDSSVYTGSAGLALFYLLQSFQSTNSQELLMNALNYINLDKLKGHRISFLCGDAGPLAIAAVISHRLGTKRPHQLPDYKAITQRLLSLMPLLNDSPDEVLYGKAGYLYALLFVKKYVNTKHAIETNQIEKVINGIIDSGKIFSLKMKSPCPLLWEWHDKVYFGAAHGMAGILYMLLQARPYINIIEIRSFIKPTLDWLMDQRFPSGNFPSSMNNTGDRLVQWCHGAPGFVALCILASQQFEDDSYMKIALKLGDVIWDRGLCAKGYSLCHGVSGNAYAFIQLYQATKDPLHLHRAYCFMEWCALERPGTELHHPDRPASLFEGLIGRMYLAQDMLNVNDAKFPAFSI